MGSKTIDRKGFAIGLLWRIGLFVALTFAFPYALYAFAAGTNCSSQHGACGAVALIFSMAFKPLAFLIFFLSLPTLLIRRLRDIGLSPWWSALVLLLILADNQLLIYAGTPWSFAFSSGVLGLSRPDYLLEALALMGVMIALPSREGRVSIEMLGWPAIATISLAALVGIAAAIRTLDSLPGIMLSVLPLRMALRVLAWPTIIALVALPLATLATLWPRDGQVSDTSSPPPPPSNPLPLFRLALLAAALTFVAMLFAMPEMGGMLVLFLPVALLPIGLPTFVAYGTLVLTIYMLAVRRSPAAYAVLAVTLLIFGSYAWQFVAEAQAKSADKDAIAAIALAPLPATLPSVILFNDGDGRGTLLQRGDISMVLSQLSNGTIVAYVRGASNRTEQSKNPPTSLPQRYLKLLIGRDSSFAQDRTRYVWGTPIELRLVEGASDQLVGVWYERQVDSPRFPPLLNLNGGWMPQQNVSNGQGNVLKDFLDRTLGVAPPPPAAKATSKSTGTTKRRSLMDLLFKDKSTVVETPR